MNFDPRTLRDALGLFVTGVTVVTARADSGQRVGVTANSFNSVSMSPPLILWSLHRQSNCLPTFQAASHFCVNILGEEQAEFSRQFAVPSEDKFAGLNTESGIGDVPLLPNCAARLECRTYARHDGGDHVIFIGEVLHLSANHEARPLVFHGGKYAALKDE